MIKTYFDGSNTSQGRAGIGYVIKDSENNTIIKNSKKYKYCSSSYLAELLALLELSLELKRLKPKGMVIIYGDNKSIIDRMKALYLYGNLNRRPRSLSRRVAVKIIRNLKSIHKFHPYFSWLPRERNLEADDLSGQASGRRRQI